jgi:hypothetical protein
MDSEGAAISAAAQYAGMQTRLQQLFDKARVDVNDCGLKARVEVTEQPASAGGAGAGAAGSNAGGGAGAGGGHDPETETGGDGGDGGDDSDGGDGGDDSDGGDGGGGGSGDGGGGRQGCVDSEGEGALFSAAEYAGMQSRLEGVSLADVLFKPGSGMTVETLSTMDARGIIQLVSTTLAASIANSVTDTLFPLHRKTSIGACCSSPTTKTRGREPPASSAGGGELLAGSRRGTDADPGPGPSDTALETTRGKFRETLRHKVQP